MVGICERGCVRALTGSLRGLPIAQDALDSKPCRGDMVSVSDGESTWALTGAVDGVMVDSFTWTHKPTAWRTTLNLQKL
jgi:hypothetical protein